MSLYRQLWSAIMASMLVALFASQFASLMNARTYLETQLTMKNRDNATTVALALSQHQPDADDVATAAMALFDSGYYELVRVAAPNGESLFEKVTAPGDLGAPAWFVELLPIRAAPGQGQINNAWHQVGNITLLSRSSFAYQALWQSAVSMALVMLIAGFVGGLLGTLVLRRLRQPMQDLVDQAQAISEHRFITSALPEVPELRQVAQAMNTMVERLRERFAEDATHYEALRREANYDALTGLAKRGFLLTYLGDLLAGQEAREGTLAVVRVADLGGLNRSHGREAADELLQAMGQHITTLLERFPGGLAGRLNGADFALLMPPDCDPSQFLEALRAELAHVAAPLAKNATANFIAFARFAPGEALGALLARVDEAMAAAESHGAGQIREAPPASGSQAPVTSAQWRVTLRRALNETDWRRLLLHPVRLDQMAGRHCECPLSLRMDAQGEWLPATRFMPVAERLGLSAELDLVSVDLACATLRATPDLAGLWLHLSAHSLNDAGFLRALLDRLNADPESAARLWLEVPEGAAMRRVEALKAWVAMLKPLSCRLGLAHCGYRFDQIGLLYELGLDFLKVDASFVRGIDQHAGNRAFLAGLREIAQRIGLLVIAEGVSNAAEAQALRELGFDGLTGPAIQAN